MKIMKRKKTKNTLAEEKHTHKMTLIVYHSLEHKLQLDSRLTSWPFTDPINAKLLQHFPSLYRGTRSYVFSKLTKHTKTFFAYSQDFSKICLRVKIWSVVLRPGRKLHWPFLSFDSTISRNFFFQSTWLTSL